VRAIRLDLLQLRVGSSVGINTAKSVMELTPPLFDDLAGYGKLRCSGRWRTQSEQFAVDSRSQLGIGLRKQAEDFVQMKGGEVAVAS